MKKRVVLWLLITFLLFSILIAVIPAETSNTQTQDKGLWPIIKEGVGGFFGNIGKTIGSAFHTTESFTTSKLGWLFGTRTFSGEKICLVK